MKRKSDSEDVGGKQPCFQLYPADLKAELSKLSLEAGCAWVRMLMEMHTAPERGRLIHASGYPYNNEDIAKLLGCQARKAESLLAEMERCGTFSRDDRGCIYNRRMVRDTAISSARRAAAGKSWANGGRPTAREARSRATPTETPEKPEEDKVIKFPQNSDNLFEEFIGLSLAAGKCLSEQQKNLALREWISLPESEYPLIVADFKRKCTDGSWTQARYVPYPHNYLKTAQWRATGPGRILPEARKMNKREEAIEQAKADFAKEMLG